VKLSNKVNTVPNNVARFLSGRRLAVSAALVLAASTLLCAGQFQPYRLVNVHTAGVLPRASFDVNFRVYAPPDGYGSGLLTGVNVGLSERFNIGLAYGGEGILGYSSRVRWNELPGVLVKYRLFEEGVATPALAVGFDNQGYGGQAHEFGYGYDGYIYKSPGFFLALSKNYLMFKTVQIGFHGTGNYSLEEAADVTWPNVACGIDIGINEELVFVAEYDFAFNDITGSGNDKNYGLPHRGFLNIGLRWTFTENFHIEFDMQDILENKTRRVFVNAPTPQNPNNRDVVRVPVHWSRELKVAYISRF
jgi:hypothetical protein